MRVFIAAILVGVLFLVGQLNGAMSPLIERLLPCVTVSGTAQVEQSGRNKRKSTKKDGGDSLSAKESATLRRRAREAIRAGDLQRATRLQRRAAGVKKRSERLAWLLFEAELEYTKKHCAKAALAAMRLVILHPRSDHVGAALYWAGRSYEGMKRPHMAIELYEECLQATSKGHNGETSGRKAASICKRAKARLAVLRKQVSP